MLDGGVHDEHNVVGFVGISKIFVIQNTILFRMEPLNGVYAFGLDTNESSAFSKHKSIPETAQLPLLFVKLWAFIYETGDLGATGGLW